MTIETEGSPGRAPLAAAEKPNSAEALATVLESLESSKAEDIVTIDLSGKTTIGDFMVVASGRSNRHVGAVADHLLSALKEAGYGNARVEGLPHCDWVLVDAGDIIVHLFRPEVRSFYNIEKMWSADRPSDVGHA
ncbi:MAG TPA: ribosome silencing factor [Kaistiaceae bacterium]|nr:ribosome silencing factor [Kaistiaceae bacterium]